MARFSDLQALIVKHDLTQAEVAERLGYREDVFSKTLRGGVKPKGGASAQEFRRAVRDTVKELAEGRQQ